MIAAKNNPARGRGLKGFQGKEKSHEQGILGKVSPVISEKKMAFTNIGAPYGDDVGAGLGLTALGLKGEPVRLH